MNDDTVIYVQCPHCKKGWYGKLLDVKDHHDGNIHILDEFTISGINPTNLTEPIYCLNCHKHYTPLSKEIKLNEDGSESIVFKDCRLLKMAEFVAERLTTCQGH